MGGMLPFGSIFIEMYFVFNSLWNYKLYYVYGIMLMVFSILLIVSASVSIVLTYFLLNAEGLPPRLPREQHRGERFADTSTLHALRSHAPAY